MTKATSTRIPLEGAYNFRDLGGLSGRRAGQPRPIRPRTVFRSDRLTRLSPADLDLLESFGIGRVFDLRSDLELAQDGPGPFPGRHRHVPLVRVSLSITDARIDWEKVDLQNRYLEMLDEGAPVIREVLEHLAAEDAPATVFHCTGGKDRTGVLAAVLLRTLGVDDEVIVDDYAISEKYLEPFVEASRAFMESEGYDPQIVLYLCGSPAERMTKMLSDMDARWGSVESYLEWTGMGEETVEALRRRLLA